MGGGVSVGFVDATGRKQALKPRRLASFSLARRAPDAVVSSGTTWNKGRRRVDGSADRLHGERIANKFS